MRDPAGVFISYSVQQTAGRYAAASVFGVGILEHHAAVEGEDRRGGPEEQRENKQ